MIDLVADPHRRLLIQTSIPAILIWLLFYVFLKPYNEKLPIINGRRRTEFSFSKPKSRFLHNAEQLLRSGLTGTQTAFKIYTDGGPRIMLSPAYANELRNHEHLVVDGIIANLYHSDIPGFEAFKSDLLDRKLLLKTLSKRLFPSLGSLTEALSSQADLGLKDRWGETTAWKEDLLKPTVLRLVSRLSCRAFCGEELCDNEEWLRIAEDYTVTADATAKKLWLWPRPMRHIVHWFMPSCQLLRSYLTQAHQILDPIIQRRKNERTQLNGADSRFRYNDMIDWLEETANGAFYDPIAAQLVLSVAAIHTTSDMLTQVIYDIFQRPQLVDQLRQELIAVLREEGGLTGACLPRLKLLDSVLKESQRLKPFALTGMHRRASRDITLTDGLQIAKHTEIEMPCLHMWDESVYPEAGEFIPDRFLRMRRAPDQENLHQLVSTSPNHMGFGYGKYACPGRFFAAAEVKTALCHILMKYEVKLVGEPPAPHRIGTVLAANVFGRVSVRRRESEVLF